MEKLKKLVSRLGQLGISISYLDLGGGLGITYRDESPPHPDEYARAVVKELRGFPRPASGSGLTLILEPGRVIVGNSGILLARVLYSKKVGRKEFVITDAGMNDLIRPALYDSFHEIIPVRPRKGPRKKVDVVGPICESGDFFARDRKLPPLRSGDLIAIMGTGAYGFSMSSNYNSRPRAAEVLVRGNRFAVIRRRENQQDLTRGETIPASLLK
jgi:diaminopimelate decarboxylase